MSMTGRIDDSPESDRGASCISQSVLLDAMLPLPSDRQLAFSGRVAAAPSARRRSRPIDRSSRDQRRRPGRGAHAAAACPSTQQSMTCRCRCSVSAPAFVCVCRSGAANLRCVAASSSLTGDVPRFRRSLPREGLVWLPSAGCQTRAPWCQLLRWRRPIAAAPLCQQRKDPAAAGRVHDRGPFSGTLMPATTAPHLPEVQAQLPPLLLPAAAAHGLAAAQPPHVLAASAAAAGTLPGPTLAHWGADASGQRVRPGHTHQVAHHNTQDRTCRNLHKPERCKSSSWKTFH